MGGGRAGTGVAAMEGGVLVPAKTHGESTQANSGQEVRKELGQTTAGAKSHGTNVVKTGFTLLHWSAGGGKGPEI